MSNVLVTGARGFIGQHLVPLLIEAGHTCRMSSRVLSQNSPPCSESNIVQFDLDDQTVDYGILLQGIDVVIHLAARVHVMEQGGQCPDIYRQTNMAGTQNLAKEAAGRGVRQFIYLSTAKVNGEKNACDEKGTTLAFSENNLAHPQGAYAMSKQEAENAIREICSESKMDFIILRPTLVYGPGVSANFLSLLNVVNKNYPLPLASVKNKRSLLYVGNLAHAISLCINNSEVVNKTYLVSDTDISVPELIRKIASLLGKKALLLPFPVNLLKIICFLTGKRSMIDRLTDSLLVDNSLLCEDLKWVPPYSFDEGLQATIDWYLHR